MPIDPEFPRKKALLDGLKEKGTLTQADINTILAAGKAA
jgi:hypothetical protein